MKNFISTFILISILSVGTAEVMGFDVLETSSPNQPSAISKVVSDVKDLVGMGTDGMDDVFGGGNTKYLKDFSNGGVSEMIK